ncbi:aldo/keto reductase [Staphylococcus condimenti]|uniref:Aldo/keto reductase n=1 Tax=Staphylococcus condimenti TaxID=70255 RepID=A0A4Q7CJQ2_9STAP|nr:aldo/keto reductase [Staphylococcus condimenti]RZI01703.1 aldo/keto reductase [Staphylococcus condimenti]
MKKTMKLNNDLKIPRLGFGVYKIDEDHMDPAVKAAEKAGYRSFDTAYIYKNETELGKALKKGDIPREKLFITSKIWNEFQGYESTKEQFKASLERLGTDYLDLYLIHWPCEADGLFIETYKAMEELYKEGLIKAIGVCNFEQHHLEKLMTETEIVPAVNQIECHPYLNQQPLQDFCDKHDIKVTAWMPLMRGRGLFEDPVIEKLAKKYEKTPAQIILNWHLCHGRIVIPKSQTPSRIYENFDAIKFELREKDVKKIDALNKNLRQGKHPDDVKIGTLK